MEKAADLKAACGVVQVVGNGKNDTRAAFYCNVNGAQTQRGQQPVTASHLATPSNRTAIVGHGPLPRWEALCWHRAYLLLVPP